MPHSAGTAGHMDWLRAFRPVFAGDALCSHHPHCLLVNGPGAGFVFVCKPNSRKTSCRLLPKQDRPHRVDPRPERQAPD